MEMLIFAKLFLHLCVISRLVTASDTVHSKRNEGLVAVPSDIPANTTELRLDGNLISFFPSDDLQYMTQLNWLSLMSNRLTTFPDVSPFSATLTILYLRDNQITSVPVEYLGHVSLLRYLTLGKNLLKVFPNLEPTKDSLVYLDLTENQITDIPAGSFLGFTELTNLDLENNQIVSVPNACQEDFWQRIASAVVSFNPFRCDCRAQHLYHLDSTLSNNLRCTEPSNLYGIKLKEDLTIADLVCEGEADPSSTFREVHMTHIRKDYYCSHPPVVLRVVTRSVAECIGICLDTSGCYYINTYDLHNGNVICDITDTTVTESVVEPVSAGNSSGWSYYSSL